jgi:hypothetical protein
MKLVVEKLNWMKGEWVRIDMSECCVTNADKLVWVTVEGYDLSEKVGMNFECYETVTIWLCSIHFTIYYCSIYLLWINKWRNGPLCVCIYGSRCVQFLVIKLSNFFNGKGQNLFISYFWISWFFEHTGSHAFV